MRFGGQTCAKSISAWVLHCHFRNGGGGWLFFFHPVATVCSILAHNPNNTRSLFLSFSLSLVLAGFGWFSCCAFCLSAHLCVAFSSTGVRRRRSSGLSRMRTAHEPSRGTLSGTKACCHRARKSIATRACASASASSVRRRSARRVSRRPLARCQATGEKQPVSGGLSSRAWPFTKARHLLVALLPFSMPASVFRHRCHTSCSRACQLPRSRVMWFFVLTFPVHTLFAPFFHFSFYPCAMSHMSSSCTHVSQSTTIHCKRSLPLPTLASQARCTSGDQSTRVEFGVVWLLFQTWQT